MKFADAIADVLIKEGVETVFGLLGGGIEEIVASAVERGIRYVKARHEEGAVGMADGYARATGKIGTALVSHGAGLSNAGTPMIVARKAGSSVLVITSGTGVDEPFMPHNFNQELFLRATVGKFTTIRSTAVAMLELNKVFGMLHRGEGPIALNLPTPISTVDVPEPWAYRSMADRRMSTNLEPRPEAVAEVAALLTSAHRPLLLAGAGAVRAGAGASMVALAERTNSALGETLRAKGLFSGHEFSLEYPEVSASQQRRKH